MELTLDSGGAGDFTRRRVSCGLAAIALVLALAGCHSAPKPAPPDLLTAGSTALKQRDYKTALADFTASLTNGDPVDARNYYDIGLANYDLKQWTAADAGFSEALKRVAAGDHQLATTFVNASYYYRGLDRVQLGKWALAKSDLLLAVKAYPKDWLDWDSLGYARAALGDYKRAVVDYDHGIPYYPKDANDLYNRGYALYYAGNAQRAVADFTSAIHLRPKWGMAYQMRGLAYAWRGDYRHADPDYSVAIKLVPKAASWEYRCEARENLGRVKEALYDCNHAVAYYPHWAVALVARAWAKATLGENQSALADANSAVRYARNYAPAYRYRGWIRVRLAEYRAAFVDYNQALRLNPRYAQASTARTVLANWIVAAQNAGVRSYGLGSINVAQAEREVEPTPSEYQQRVSECGGYYSEGDSYYDDCIEKGVDEAKNDESADHEADQQAAEVGYNVEQQVQEDVNYQVAAAEEEQAAQAEESSNGGYSGGGESGEPEQEYSEPETQSEPESEPEPAAEPEGGGE